MRRVAGIVCVLVLSGCGAATDTAITAQDAKNNLAVKDRAVSQLATTQLTAIQRQAQQWAEAHAGAMTGFAADLKDTQPSIASAAAVLTDTSASVSTGAGQCLTAALPTGPATAGAC